MNPYELRWNILKQSFDYFDNKYNNEIEEWKTTGKSINDYPTYFSFDDVFKLAIQKYSFVEDKNK